MDQKTDVSPRVRNLSKLAGTPLGEQFPDLIDVADGSHNSSDADPGPGSISDVMRHEGGIIAAIARALGLR